MDKQSCDFHCWVIKYDKVCIQGKLYQKDSLKGCDGTVVPLLWNHQHDDPTWVLGQALLENRDEGVYGYFNLYSTPSKGMIDNMINHFGSVSTSPCVLQVTVKGDCVVKGRIAEVSLTPARVDPDVCYYPILNKEKIDEG